MSVEAPIAQGRPGAGQVLAAEMRRPPRLRRGGGICSRSGRPFALLVGRHVGDARRLGPFPDRLDHSHPRG